MASSDPRIFFAAERTLLAWLRTGITIIGLGFVVSRFGLFLELLSAQSPARSLQPDARVSTWVGVLLVLIGAGSIAMAALQHRRFLATLSVQELPPAYSRTWAIALASLVSLAGLGLAIHMLRTLP